MKAEIIELIVSDDDSETMIPNAVHVTCSNYECMLERDIYFGNVTYVPQIATLKCRCGHSHDFLIEEISVHQLDIHQFLRRMKARITYQL